MKFRLRFLQMRSEKSPPSRGAWIEIPRGGGCALIRQSPPSRGAWIEIAGSFLSCFTSLLLSPPSRGAWIEIRKAMMACGKIGGVAPLAGGVD